MEDVYCNRCPNYYRIFDLLSDWKIYDVQSTDRGYMSLLEECPNCKNTITPGSYLIMDEIEFINVISVQIAKELSEEVGECQNCNEDIIPYTQRHGDPLSLKTIYDLVENHDLPSGIKDIVYSNIYCSNCETALESDQPYVTSNEVDRWYQNDIEIMVSTFDFTEYEGKDFIDYLIKNPMLGLNHSIGEKIFQMIKNQEIPGITYLKASERLFRGRKRNNIERIAPYIAEELWNPPEGIPGQGRYNPPGISSLYLANNHKVIGSELNFKEDEDSIDIAEFLILEDMLLWDVRGKDIDIFSSIPSFNKKFVLKQEYIFPNFIAQCLMANNYKGVVYQSTRGEGSNYCLFNFQRDKDIVITRVTPFNRYSIQPLKQFGKTDRKGESIDDFPF